MLERALTLLGEERLEEGLAELLAAWGHTPAPHVAELIDLVGARLSRPPIAGKTFDEVQLAWRAIADDEEPADLPRLLAALPRGRVGQAAARVAALGERPADPRLSAGLLKLLDDPPFHKPSTRPFWERVLGVVVAIADPRAVPALEAAREKVRARFATLMITWLTGALTEAGVKIATKRRNQPTRLGRAEEARAQAIAALFQIEEKRASAKLASVEEYLTKILEHPEDDGLRKVFGDWLQERGDPRGELIALQYAHLDAPPTPAALRRERALLKQHGMTWLGKLGPVLLKDRWVFERGFLSTCWYDPKVAARATTVIGASEWATVREIEFRNFAGGKTARAAELIGHPIMRSLRRVTGLWEVTAVALASAPAPIPLEFMGFMAGKVTTAAVKALSEPRGLPRLVGVGLEEVHAFTPDRHRWLLESPLGRRLERLTANGWINYLPGWIEELETHGGPKLTSFALHTNGFILEIMRVGTGAFSALRAELTGGSKQQDPFGPLISLVLQNLGPKALTSIEVVAPERLILTGAEVAKLARAVERFKLQSVKLPAAGS